jgi:hypothetical protein
MARKNPACRQAGATSLLPTPALLAHVLILKLSRLKKTVKIFLNQS